MNVKTGALRVTSCCVIAATLAGCAAKLPDVAPIASMDSVKDLSLDRFAKDNDHLPVQHVRLRSGALSVVRVNKPVASEMRHHKVDYSFGTDKPTLGDLVQALGVDGVQVSVPAMPDSSSSSYTPPASNYDSDSPSKSGSSLQGILAGNKDKAGSGGGLRSSMSAPASGGKAEGKDIYARRLPFARFTGTLGDLLDSLKTSAGLVSWQEGTTIYLSDTDRFSVTVPQNEDIVGQLGQTIHDLGATDIVASVQGGKIFYSAPASLQRDTIAPFLTKAVRNLATFNLQVAIVSLAITDKSGNGFDWSQFSTKLGNAGLLAGNGGTAAGYGSGYGAGYGSAYGTGLGNTAIGTSSLGTTADATGTSVSGNGASATLGTAADAFNLSLAGTGKIMGIRTVGTISTAVNYLSTFGSANVKQNVDLRTVSGKTVKFAAQDEIPYVKSVGVGAIGSGGYGGGGYGGTGSGYGNGLGSGTLGTAQTDSVKTGLEVAMQPQYDSENDLCIIDMKMTLASLIEMIQLNAGAQLGTLTQPHTQKQELTDILRIRAGQTAVIGGLQVDSDQKNGNEPTSLRALGNTDTSYGSRTQDVQRTALFIIVRPSVVVYDTEGPGK